MIKKFKSIKDKPFWQKPLAQLNDAEWEALCDGCGKCCLLKFQDDETEEVLFTKVACKLLDTKTCSCTDYPNRTEKVAECFRITADNIFDVYQWLPNTCAYKLRYNKQPLPSWHYLISGSKETVHKTRQSVTFFAITPNIVSPEQVEQDLEKYIVDVDS